jgi:hypothetical protein
MPDRFLGDAWVVIRPDISKFEAELAAGVMDAGARAQTQADANPIDFKAAIDKAGAVASTTAARGAMQAVAMPPITFTVAINSAKALAELSAIRALSGLMNDSVAGGIGGGGGGGATIAAGGADSGGGGMAAGLIAQKVLGVGAGSSRNFGIAAAGAFSVASLAGLGFEHVLTTAIGLAGSLAGAVAGGLVLAATAAGVAFVGMGSDMLVMRSTIADTQALYKNLELLRQAQIQYGVNSAQAAQQQKILNVQIQMLGNTAGVAAELALAKSVQALNIFWDKATSGARVAAVGILQQFVDMAHQYIPLVAAAAQRNFTIIGNAIKGPGSIMEFLAGPGKKIFADLENVFARNLPTAVHAFTQAFELVFKIIDQLAPGVGGLTAAIDKFLTNANSASGFPKTMSIVNTLVGMFHTWWDFFKILAIDIVDFFKLTAGVGTAIVTSLTGMLTKLHEWLNLTTTQTSLHNLFELHKQQVLDLLQLLPVLLTTFGHIYLAVAPLLTGALVQVLNALLPILKAITSNAWGAWAVGLALILSKFGILGSVMNLFGRFVAMLVPGFTAVTTSAAAAAAATGDAGLAGAATKAGTAFKFMGLGVGTLGLVLGGLALGAILLVSNWDQVTHVLGQPFQSAAGLAAESVGKVDSALQGLNAQAAKDAIQGITSNLQGFADAVHSNSISIGTDVGQTMSDLQTEMSTVSSQIVANKAAIVSTTPNSFAGFNLPGSHQTVDPMVVKGLTAMNAALAEIINKRQVLYTTLQDLSSGFNKLALPVQAAINEVAQFDKTGATAAAVYTQLKGVQDQAIPSFDAAGRMIGTVSLATDQYRNAILKGIQAGGAYAAVYQTLLTQWDQSGGLIGKDTTAILGSLSPWQQLHDQIYNEGIAQGLSADAAKKHADILANTLDPAGANANDVISRMTDQYNKLHPKMTISVADMQLLVQNNPALLQAFLDQAQAAKDDADRLAILNGELAKIPQLARDAAAALHNAAITRALASGGVGTGGLQAQHGAVANAGAGQHWMLHGIEAIIPKDRAQPWLWSAMMDTLAGRLPQLPQQGSPIAALSAVGPRSSSAAPFGSSGPVSLTLNIHNNSGTVGEMQSAVRQEFRTLVLALRAR